MISIYRPEEEKAKTIFLLKVMTDIGFVSSGCSFSKREHAEAKASQLKAKGEKTLIEEIEI